MTVFLAGMRMTADRLNDHTLEDSVSSGATAATDWSVVSFEGRKVNGITTINAFCNRTGAAIAELVAGSGNITDTAMVTLPVGWRPPSNHEGLWGNGTNDGSVVISSTTGIITVRSTSGSAGIASGSNVRVSASWISENG
ncbi:hypothetical protein [Streptomyces sp. NBC_00827]|uniref:hypothetical protein n=1 Tax=Streptomyces sp. NBC_00827 TaxID=2903677 RepID=UPI0038636D43|nr:hypothetical protein OG569_02110 [Streptomyces sp. NBC_00827]